MCYIIQLFSLKTIYKVNTYPNKIYKYRFHDSDATKHLELDGEGSADGPIIPPDYDTSKAAAKGIAKSNVLHKNHYIGKTIAFISIVILKNCAHFSEC